MRSSCAASYVWNCNRSSDGFIQCSVRIRGGADGEPVPLNFVCRNSVVWSVDYRYGDIELDPGDNESSGVVFYRVSFSDVAVTGITGSRGSHLVRV